MVELFADVPAHIKEQAELWVNLALRQNNPVKAMKIMEEFRPMLNDREKEFVDFYFNLRLEKLKNL